MREAIGSTWLIGIVITFIAIFSGFLAYSISYTKAFRVKNEIINIIEKNEGFSNSSNVDLNNIDDNTLKEDSSTEAKAFRFIKSIGYDYAKFDSSSRVCEEGTLQTGGYCLVKYCPTNGETSRIYYKVTTYISLSIPIINIGINLPISGETKALYNDIGAFKCEGE